MSVRVLRVGINWLPPAGRHRLSPPTAPYGDDQKRLHGFDRAPDACSLRALSALSPHCSAIAAHARMSATRVA